MPVISYIADNGHSIKHIQVSIDEYMKHRSDVCAYAFRAQKCQLRYNYLFLRYFETHSISGKREARLIEKFLTAQGFFFYFWLKSWFL